MAVLTHTVNFHVVFSGLNDFVQDGDYVISDNTIGTAFDQVRTIDEITRSPNSAEYTPVSPLDGTDLKYEWWAYRQDEIWDFNIWDVSSKTAFANDICQTLYNSMHEKISEWIAVYGQADYGGYVYPFIDDLNVYICWGKPLLTDKINTMSQRQIFVFFYRGNDPEAAEYINTIITINEKTI